jgi:hypothetical protein
MQQKLGQAGGVHVAAQEAALAQAQLNLPLQTLASRLADTAAQFQALGGGRWHRPNVPTAKQQRANVSK